MKRLPRRVPASRAEFLWLYPRLADLPYESFRSRRATASPHQARQPSTEEGRRRREFGLLPAILEHQPRLSNEDARFPSSPQHVAIHLFRAAQRVEPEPP